MRDSRSLADPPACGRFLLAAFLSGLAWFGGQGQVLYWGAGLAVAGFLMLAVYHEHVQRQRQRHGLLRQINEHAVARLHRDWTALPELPVEAPPPQRAVADDLDLFGHGSLFHWLCAAQTPTGIRVLRDWLLEPASPEEIPRRQQALVELAPRLELRQTLTLEGRLLADRGQATDRFLSWAEGRPWLTDRPWLLWPCRTIPAAGVLAVALAGLQVVSVELAAITVLTVVLLNFLLSVLFVGSVHDIFTLIYARSGSVRRYLRMFELLYAMPDSATELDAVKREATTLGGGALGRLRQLNRIAGLTRLQHSALLFVFVYLPLQFLFLFDFHVLNLLEAWQTRYGRYARGWFLALGKFEALSSLATLVYDHPEWTLPEVRASADRFQARQLGHPLLRNETRVANDLEIGPAGSILLVTGSNMSGKSTLLRAAGVNAVLAQAGAPACAERLVIAAAGPGDQHADPRFAGRRRVVLHGRVAALKRNRRPGARAATAIGTRVAVPPG